MRVGIIGCGNISDVYVRNAKLFNDIEIIACSDIIPAAAQRLAHKYSLREMDVGALLAADDIEIILNLTLPTAHAEVSRAAIAAGKHVYSEKPLATSLQDAVALIEEAEAKGLRVGSAPDTILGAGLQTAKALIDDGCVGQIITGLAAVMTKGMEHWHPNPAVFYQKGAGPVLDLGPYYVSALTALLGPVSQVRAVGQISPLERRYGAEGPKKGKTFSVGTFTTLNAILTFFSGANVSFLASWDVWRHGVRPIELHGTLASIRVPDPDTFGGDVELSANNRLLNIHDASERCVGRHTGRLAHPQNRRKDIRRDQLSHRESGHSELPFAWSRRNGKCYSRGPAPPVLGSLRVARTGGNARDHRVGRIGRTGGDRRSRHKPPCSYRRRSQEASAQAG